MIFSKNGKVPSLSQVVALAQSHVTVESRKEARYVDREVYNNKSSRKAKRYADEFFDPYYGYYN